MVVIKPPRLKQGDQIGIISPAGPVSEPDLQPGIKALESSGFKIRLAPHVFDTNDYLAGNDEGRLEDLHRMFLDREINAIICARGGYGSLKLLDKIRYDLIRQNPKIIVGYSDITALLMAFHAKTGMVTFHGPMVREFSSGDPGNLDNLLRLVSSNQPPVLPLGKGSVIRQGKVQGRVIGGNLSLICHLIGTPFFPSLDGFILFIEDRGEPLYRVDRMVTHLKLSGRLKGLAGLIVGEFEGCGEMPVIDRLFRDILSDLDIPMASGLPVGHGLKNLAIPIGLRAELDTDLMTLSVLERCVT